MATIKQLKDHDTNENIYPLTHIDAVRDSNNNTVQELLDEKQDELTFDTTPTSDSSNPVTSGGIYNALSTKQNKLTFDQTPTANSDNPVVSKGIKSALDTKVSKVTSTDNAIVRFDGITGNVQNSSAKVEDNGDISVRDVIVHGSYSGNDLRMITSSVPNNIYFRINNKVPFVVTDTEIRSLTTSGIAGTINLGSTEAYWNNVYGKKFIVQGGTSSKFLKGDGSLDSSSYAKNEDYQMPTNSMSGGVAGFGAHSVHQNLINNGLFAADKRYTVTLTGFSDNTKAERLFDGSYESYIQVPSNGTGTILIEHTSELFGSYYCYGNTYMTFYYGRVPESVTMRVYGKASSNASRDWYDISSTKVIDTANNCIVKFTNTSIGSCTKFEFTITAKESSNAWPVQIDQQFNRGTAQMMSAITKYPVPQSLYGDLTAPKFIKRGGTSAQFLKADGSVDSNSYLTASSSTITDILQRLTNIEQRLTTIETTLGIT